MVSQFDVRNRHSQNCWTENITRETQFECTISYWDFRSYSTKTKILVTKACVDFNLYFWICASQIHVVADDREPLPASGCHQLTLIPTSNPDAESIKWAFDPANAQETKKSQKGSAYELEAKWLEKVWPHAYLGGTDTLFKVSVLVILELLSVTEFASPVVTTVDSSSSNVLIHSGSDSSSTPGSAPWDDPEVVACLS